jgi:PQQ-like domain
MKRVIFAAPLAALLFGCGGGGGGGGSAPSIRMMLSPSTLDVTQYEGDSASRQVTATATVSGNIPGPVYVVIVQDAAVLEGTPEITQSSATSYIASLQTASALDPGHHAGTLTVKVCSSPECQTTYGSATLPYAIEVLSNTNLTPLAALSGATDWTTAQGDATHSGFVPVTLDAADFSSRWRIDLRDYGVDHADLTEATAATTAAGGVFLTAGYGGYRWTVALDEYDGSLNWSEYIGQNTWLAVSPAATSDGKVYVTAYGIGSVADGNPRLYIFDMADGTNGTPTMFQQGANTPSLGTPTVAGGAVYAAGGGLYGTQAFNDATGALLWTKAYGGRQASTAAVSGSVAYAVGDPGDGTGSLMALSTVDGAQAWKVPFFTLSTDFYEPQPQPAITSGGHVVVSAPNSLSLINTSTQTLQWGVSGSFINRPALSPNGEIYVLSQSPLRLQARKESDGQVLWSWTPPVGATTFVSDVIATNNMAFVSTDRAVYAIDLAARSIRWSYPYPGYLAMSANGLLLISRTGGDASKSGFVTAVNLH